MTDTQALCATQIHTVGDLWFSSSFTDRAQAKRICARCPLREACAQAGLDAGDQARGVWGGLSSGDRRVLRTGEHAPDPDDDSDDAPPRKRPRQACGTPGAHQAHRLAGEACEVCETAHTARVEAGRRERLAAAHEQGGTDAGYGLHRLLGEPPCEGCRQAAIRKRAENRARRREEGRAAWERRGDALAASEAAA